VTIEDIQRVATTYVKPEEAAIVIVGDGSAILDQITPYSTDIETYNTAGKRKDQGESNGAAVELAGAWDLVIDTPFGQAIPATLTINQVNSVYSAAIVSDLGSADFPSITVQDNSINASTTLEMDGRAIPIEVAAHFEGDRTEGTVKMQNTPPLSFTGNKAS
jgi:hypothetical protein